MKFISIFNDVLGPVMRGPSSSHTAGSYRIGKMARSLLGDNPVTVTFTFDPEGSYAKTYRQQGVDLAFAAGIMDIPFTSEHFEKSLELADKQGVTINFNVSPLENPAHPNTAAFHMAGKNGKKLSAVAESTGGGGVLIRKVDDWQVTLDGKSSDVLVECDKTAESRVNEFLSEDKRILSALSREVIDSRILFHGKYTLPLKSEFLAEIESISGVRNLRAVEAVFDSKRGDTIFTSAQEMVDLAQERKNSLGQIAMAYECELLGMTEEEAIREMGRRYEIMRLSVIQGLEDDTVRMQLLKPSAGKIFTAEKKGTLAIGGIHTRAAARAMSTMHVSNSMGVVCAAPTGGSAGVIPGVIVTLAEEKNMNREDTALALFAASAVGLITGMRATFAAETAGCQVEIGAAGAMAAAAVVEAAGGSARQATDAASIAFQNTRGSVCDLVQGMCEIPCHTRNAAAASSAFVCADLIIGGYTNPIPLDETIDAVYAVGKMLPRELRCTAMGGIAVAPSALSMENLRRVKS